MARQSKAQRIKAATLVIVAAIKALVLSAVRTLCGYVPETPESLTVDVPCRYPVSLETARVHLVKGNGKLGQHIYNVSMLSGEGLVWRKCDGLAVSNLPGTCGGCCEHCMRDCYDFKSLRYEGASIARAENTLLMRHDPVKFWADVFAEFGQVKDPAAMLRIHVGGEFDSPLDMAACFMAAAASGETRPVYTYTKRYEWLRALLPFKPGNFSVLTSLWGEFGETVEGCAVFVMDDGSDPEIAAMPHCPAVGPDGHPTGITCSECKRCPRGMSSAVYKH